MCVDSVSVLTLNTPQPHTCVSFSISVRGVRVRHPVLWVYQSSDLQLHQSRDWWCKQAPATCPIHYWTRSYGHAVRKVLAPRRLLSHPLPSDVISSLSLQVIISWSCENMKHNENSLRLMCVCQWLKVRMVSVSWSLQERHGLVERWAQRHYNSTIWSSVTEFITFFSSRRALCIISIQSHACPILMWNYYTDKETAIWSDPLSLPLNYTSRFSASTEKLQREPGHFRSTQVLFILIPNVRQWKLLLLLQWIKNTLFWKWPAVSFALLRVQLNEWFWI